MIVVGYPGQVLKAWGGLGCQGEGGLFLLAIRDNLLLSLLEIKFKRFVIGIKSF